MRTTILISAIVLLSAVVQAGSLKDGDSKMELAFPAAHNLRVNRAEVRDACDGEVTFYASGGGHCYLFVRTEAHRPSASFQKCLPAQNEYEFVEKETAAAYWYRPLYCKW